MNIIEYIGNTPLVLLKKTSKILNSNIFGKIEYFNPGKSIKDRVAFYIIKQAMKNNLISKDSIIVEATSGNTGIGLALVCALYNLKLKIYMPENMSIERKKILRAYNSELVLTPQDLGMSYAVKSAKQFSQENKKVYLVNQFENEANVLAHYNTTAQEIWFQSKKNIDILVAGIGTGGTITGCGKFLRKKNPKIKIIGVEPYSSAVLSKEKAGTHKIQGIGAGFIPQILDTNIYDEIIKIKDEDAYQKTSYLSKEESLFCGISSGAVLQAIFILSQKYKNKNIVGIFPDSGERYLSVENLF